jgi:hypothetical protein
VVQAQRSSSRAEVLLPVWGLASAGGAVSFFGGFWVLPSDWHMLGVVAGVVGGAVAGWLLGHRGDRCRVRQEAEPSAAPDGDERS